MISQPFLGGPTFFARNLHASRGELVQGRMASHYSKTKYFLPQNALDLSKSSFLGGKLDFEHSVQGNVDCSQCIPYWNCVNGFCNEEP